MRNPFVISVVYVLLALVAIPWYWRWLPSADRIVFGVPLWVASALVGSAIVSCYTGWLLSHPWQGEERDGVDP